MIIYKNKIISFLNLCLHFKHKHQSKRDYNSIAFIYHNGIGVGDTLMISAMARLLEEQLKDVQFYHVEDKYKLFSEHNYLTMVDFYLDIKNIDMIIIPEFSLRYLKYLPVLLKKNFIGYITPKLQSNFLMLHDNFILDYRTQHWMDRIKIIGEYILGLKINSELLEYKFPKVSSPSFALPDNYIVFNPFSLVKQKSFTISFFIEILRSILNFSDTQVVLLGTKNFKEESSFYEFDKRVVNLVGMTSLSEVAWIIKNSIAFVGNDSGLMHISFAFKKPVFSFFKGIKPELRKPLFYHEGEIFFYYTPCLNCPVFPCYDPINGHLYDSEKCQKYSKIDFLYLKNKLSNFFDIIFE